MSIIFHNNVQCMSTHWGRVTHICVGKLIIIGSDNGLSPDRRQAIISTNAGLLSIGPLRTYFCENLIKIQQFSLKKMRLKISSAKLCPFRLGVSSGYCIDIHGADFKCILFKLIKLALAPKLMSDKCHRTSLMESQHWFVESDLCRHMASLGHN